MIGEAADIRATARWLGLATYRSVLTVRRRSRMITQVTVNIRFDGRALRATSVAESFPWLDRCVTLVRVTPDGVVMQAKSDGEKRAMLGNADDDDLLLAAWPGEWSQDVFVVDDLKGARASLGLPRYKAVATSPDLPVDAVVRPRGDDPRGLWGHLAGLGALPAEGQRQVAATPGSRHGRSP
jgi:hypothetical protein